MRKLAGFETKPVSNFVSAASYPDDAVRWEQFVSSVRSIPVLAESVYQLSNLLMVNPVDLSAVGRVIRIDLGLAAQVLKLVNSGASDVPVHDLEYATVHLGIDPLRALILTVPVLSSDGPDPVLRLWKHSLQCAEVCEWLARRTEYDFSDRAYIAGLLHDLGRVPLIAWQLATTRDERIDLVTALPDFEDKTFGVNHQVIGGWMAVTWNLPDFLIHVLENHHSRPVTGDSLLLQVVRAADSFCNREQYRLEDLELIQSLSGFTSQLDGQELFAELCESFPFGENLCEKASV